MSTEVIPHPEFSYSNNDMDNDVALLRLSAEPSCASEMEAEFPTLGRSEDLTGEYALVAGWGQTEEGAAGSSSSLLLEEQA